MTEPQAPAAARLRSIPSYVLDGMCDVLRYVGMGMGHIGADPADPYPASTARTLLRLVEAYNEDSGRTGQS